MMHWYHKVNLFSFSALESSVSGNALIKIYVGFAMLVRFFVENAKNPKQ